MPRLVFVLLLLSACAQQPTQQGLPREWLPSPNFGERRPSLVVLHHTSSPTVEQAAAVLRDPAGGVSAHYLIGRDGRLYQLVDERMRAWHAGVARWGGNADLNSASIGIELDNDGFEPYAEPQIVKLLALLDELRQKYSIPAQGFVGHGDIAPRRKADPSRYFPWRRLAQQGFGLWCEAPLPAAPFGMDDLLALQAFGYDVADPNAARTAFRRHFRNVESPAQPLNEDEMAVLACLNEAKRR